MTAESPFRGAHAPSRAAFGGPPNVCYKKSATAGPVANPPATSAPPKLNNRSGLASDESIQRQAVRIGRVDTIVNDVKFFLHKYEHGESHRGN